MSSEFHGLEDLEERFDQMSATAEELKSPKAVSFNELFDSSFMSVHSSFTSFDEFLSAGGYHLSTTKELEAVLGASFDEFVSRMTDFTGWEEMFREASTYYLTKALNS